MTRPEQRDLLLKYIELPLRLTAEKLGGITKQRVSQLYKSHGIDRSRYRHSPGLHHPMIGERITVLLSRYPFATTKEIAEALDVTPALIRRAVKFYSIKFGTPAARKFTKGIRRCSTCRRDHPLSSFHRCAKNRYGLQGSCKECMTILSHRARIRRNKAGQQ